MRYTNTFIQIPMSATLHASLEKVACQKNFHTREFIRGLIDLFANKAVRKPDTLTGSTLMTRKTIEDLATSHLVIPTNANTAQKLDTLSKLLDCPAEAVVYNIIELVVRQEAKKEEALV